MPNGRDEDALSWGGDDDPTLDVGSRPADLTPLPDGFTAVGRGSDAVVTSSADDSSPESASADPVSDDRPSQLGNAALICLGLLGGIYLLFTIGWLIGGLRLQGVAVFLVDPVAFVPALWLAVLAPAIWFAATLLLTRGAAAWQRWVWLVAGAVLFVPWPFIMIGAVGAA
jgi:hypothetical protein